MYFQVLKLEKNYKTEWLLLGEGAVSCDPYIFHRAAPTSPLAYKCQWRNWFWLGCWWRECTRGIRVDKFHLARSFALASAFTLRQRHAVRTLSLASLISQTSRRKRQPSVRGMNNLPEVLNSSLRRSADSLQWMDGERWRCDAEARCRQREKERNMVWRKMSRERMHRQGDEFGVSSAHRAVIISRQWMEKKNVSAIH